MIVVFCLMLFGGSLAISVVPDEKYSDLENRQLQQKPKFTKKNFTKGKFQKEYETYLNDQFPFRDKWVDIAVALQAKTGKRDINGVYIGKKGYLLENNQEKEVDKQQIKENVNTLTSFLNDMEKQYGKNHISCMMVPSKSLAMTNRMPAYTHVKEPKEVLASIREKLQEPSILLDLKDTMQKHQKEYIYYRTDHHWTTLGAYYAYKEWAKKTGQAKEYPLKHYKQEKVFDDFYGTTYNKAHIPVEKDQVVLFHNTADEKQIHINMDKGEVKADTLYFPKAAKKGFNRYDVFLSKNTFQMEITTKANTGKTLLLIKDSFANCFVPFLTESYDRIVLIDYRYGKMPISTIQSDYPDITDVLVLFNTEKFMENTKLSKLAETQKGKQTVEEFDVDEFLE